MTVRRAERVVFHVGMPKTGSTAIQRILAANRAYLQSEGVFFPRALSRGGAHHPLAWSASLDRVPRDGVPPLLEGLHLLSDEVAGAEQIVISSEALFYLPRGEWTSIVEWATSVGRSVDAIVYIRPPADFHEGWYRQLVKNRGYSSTFAEHLSQAPIIMTSERMAVLEDLFGLQNLRVRPYLRAAFKKGDILEDFCAQLGIDPNGLDRAHDIFVNPSLDAELTEFKALLHKRGLPQTPRLERVFIAWSEERKMPYRSLYSPASWDAFVAETRDEHGAVCARYGLPRDLEDSLPSQFTHLPMSRHDFETLLTEFQMRFG